MIHDKKSFFRKLLPFLLLYVIFSQYIVNNSQLQRNYTTSMNEKNRKVKERITWSDNDKHLSNLQFWRIFRMTRKCFALLCNINIAGVGENAFKSES